MSCGQILASDFAVLDCCRLDITSRSLLGGAGGGEKTNVADAGRTERPSSAVCVYTLS